MPHDALLTPPPATTSRLCLVRHGETDWNAERRLQGHLDIALNDKGMTQAEATAHALAAHCFDALYSSDLLRARQTATAIATRQDLQARLEPRLRERHYGLFQGLRYAEAEQRHPTLYQRFLARDADFSFPEGGESLRSFARRIGHCLEEIASRHRGQTVIIVTHGGVLDIAHRLASGLALEHAREFGIPNAALNWLQHDGRRWQLLAWAEQAHLSRALDELPNA